MNSMLSTLPKTATKVTGTDLDLAKTEIPKETAANIETLEGVSVLPSSLANFANLKNITITGKGALNLNVINSTLKTSDITLTVNNREVEGTHVSELKKVANLTLNNCTVKQPPKGVVLPKEVKTVDLSGTTIENLTVSGSVETIKDLGIVKVLRIQEHKQLSSILDKIPTGVTSLDLTGCDLASVPADFLKKLPNLKTLNLTNAKNIPTDLAMPDSVDKIEGKNIESIVLTNIPTREFLTRSKDAMQNVKKLILKGVIIDKSIPELQDQNLCTALEALDFSEATVTATELQLNHRITTLILPKDHSVTTITAKGHSNPGALLEGITPKDKIKFLDLSDDNGRVSDLLKIKSRR